MTEYVLKMDAQQRSIVDMALLDELGASDDERARVIWKLLQQLDSNRSDYEIFEDGGDDSE